MFFLSFQPCLQLVGILRELPVFSPLFSWANPMMHAPPLDVTMERCGVVLPRVLMKTENGAFVQTKVINH